MDNPAANPCPAPAIAKDWYEVHTIADGISLIRESYIADWVRCNIWHVRGRDRDILIDSGMGLRPLKREVTSSSASARSPSAIAI